MKRPARKPVPDSPRPTAAILSSFCRVRILYYVAAKPVPSSMILVRLRSHGCSIAPATLNRLLQRMARNGWLKSKSPTGNRSATHRTYSLTPGGYKVLNLARERIEALVSALASGPGQTRL